MSHCVIVGSQWGDEGKAKVIDYLTEKSDVIIRFQGGANAGHTVIAGGEKFVFHLVPSGIMYPDKNCIVGNGVVFDAEQFLNEVDELESKNISTEGRLFVSDLAHIVLPYHKALDKAAESQKGDKKIGTTGRGIGPAYADKVSRLGIRVGDMLDWDSFVQKVSTIFQSKEKLITNFYESAFNLSLDTIIEKYRLIRERLLPMITDTSKKVYDFDQAGKNILFEGAQGTFLDIDHGTYPFVTSSNTIAGSVCTGVGIGPTLIKNVVGIVKTYTTRVGNGPFPTELHDDTGECLQREGGEFGATTGRPRRCGWFDSVMLRKAIQLNGMTHMALTKLDVLNKLETIKICTHYEIDGKKTDTFPTNLAILERAKPVYEEMEGWKADLSEAKRLEELPEKAQKYLKRLQELCYNKPILMVSMGPDRNETIEVASLTA